MAVHLTRIYTRTGDDGTTGLSDFSRVCKNDTRLVAYADCDEANAAIGAAIALGNPTLRITQSYIDRLEAWCDQFNESLPPLKSFVLPGGSALSALLHVARTVARRAERAAWDAIEEHPSDVSPLPAKYLNRLSDLLFILCRVVNPDGDVLWQPGGGRSDQPKQ